MRQWLCLGITSDDAANYTMTAPVHVPIQQAIISTCQMTHTETGTLTIRFEHGFRQGNTQFVRQHHFGWLSALVTADGVQVSRSGRREDDDRERRSSRKRSRSRDRRTSRYLRSWQPVIATMARRLTDLLGKHVHAGLDIRQVLLISDWRCVSVCLQRFPG